MTTVYTAGLTHDEIHHITLANITVILDENENEHDISPLTNIGLLVIPSKALIENLYVLN